MKRKSEEQKLKILSYARDHGMTAAAKKFRVSATTLARWSDQLAKPADKPADKPKENAKVLNFPVGLEQKPMTQKEELQFLREKVGYLMEQRDQIQTAFENLRKHATELEKVAMEHHMAAIRAVAERDTYSRMLQEFVTARSAAEVVFSRTVADAAMPAPSPLRNGVLRAVNENGTERPSK